MASLCLQNGGVILYFDPLTEELRMVPFPMQWDDFWRDVGLGTLDGQLTLAFKVHDNPIQVCAPLRILSRMTDDEILIDGVERLVLYNLRNRSSRDLLFLNRHHLIVS